MDVIVNKRLKVARGLFLVLIVLLLVRVSYLQLVVSRELAVQALWGRVSELPLRTLRGQIVDRRERPFTDAVEKYSVIAFPTLSPSCIDELTRRLPAGSFRGSVDAVKPTRIATGIDAKAAAEIAALNLSGVAVIVEPVRYGTVASHLIGYAGGHANSGLSGLEYKYDAILGGCGNEYAAALRDGGKQVITGLGYRKIRTGMAEQKNTVVLTLDRTIQQQVENIFDRHGYNGAAIVMESATGEILAMVSRPNFNAGELAAYLKRPDAPLLNRAVGAYPPGSVFKLAVAAAALEERVVESDSVFIDKGFIDVDGTVFSGWDETSGERELTLAEAMAYSSNPVFIELGLRLGQRSLVSYARKFGFGQVTGLDLPSESAGLLPPTDSIYRGVTANLAIGQGECEVTPLQIAAFVAAIANDGLKPTPVALKKALTHNGRVILQPKPRAERIMTGATARTLQNMMRAVTQYGTGMAAGGNDGRAGKTGTAETGRSNAGGQSINHAWFAGYAPIRQKSYTIVVFVENGRSGGAVAAPVFGEIATLLTGYLQEHGDSVE